MTLDGRWTVFVCTGCESPTGRHKDCDAVREATPVVPCDPAAVERAASALLEANQDFSGDYAYEMAELALRAAGSKP